MLFFNPKLSLTYLWKRQDRRPNTLSHFLVACLVFAGICLPTTPIYGQYWMQQMGGLTVEEGYDIATDASGNTYTTGYFSGTMTVGAGNLNATGSTDIFVVKTNNQGVFQWAEKAGGSNADRGQSIVVDGQGNSYVTGYFSGTATFGTQTLTSSGSQDLFVAKYSSGGALQWAVQAGGSQTDIGNGIAIDNSGNVLVTGEFSGTATFGTATLTSQNNSVDVFTTKLTNSGNFVWAEIGTGSQINRGIDVAADNSGNVYIVGQYSDTITFDVQHPNTGFNSVFVVKYDANGQEQWFRKIGGGASNFGNAIATTGNGDVYITGDFTGSLTFFGNPNTVINSTYTNKVFVANYSTSGNLSWANAIGSDNSITSRDIGLDGLGNAAIVGDFTCRLNEFADEYGQGTFNAIGGRDVFVANFNAAGVFGYSRHVGGRSDDFGFGVALSGFGRIHYTGSFGTEIIIPTSSNFIAGNLSNWTARDCLGNSPYCNDPDYGQFHGISSTGNLDIIIANCFDPGRQPLDFYLRFGTTCSRPEGDVCVNGGCPDTVKACGPTTLNALTNFCPNIGPMVNYQWSGNGGTTSSANYGTGGYKSVTVTTVGGCYSYTDSTYLAISPPPASPTITDDAGFNLNSVSPVKIELCDPDTVTVTAGNLGTNAFFWSGGGLPPNYTQPSFTATTSGTYFLTVYGIDSCELITNLEIDVVDSLMPVELRISAEDSLELCANQSFQVFVYDSLVNPTGAALCLSDVQTSWTVSPNVPILENCQTFALVNPTNPGWYVFEATVVRQTLCESDTTILVDSVYIDTLPTPIVLPFNITVTGPNFYCPGDSALLVASGGPSYQWTGPNVNNLTSDSVFAYSDGFYLVTSTVRDTNSFGCIAQYTATGVKQIFQKPQPMIMASSLLLCPNDTVTISTASSGTTFDWSGPGIISGNNTSSILANVPGSYSVTVNDADSCGLVSNTIPINQYATPSLSATNAVLCDGDSVVISVISSDTSLIEWQAPLSGSGISRTVFSAGTYTAKITVCGIITFADIEVLAASSIAVITSSGPLCAGDSITLNAPPGLSNYIWSTSPNDTNSSITVTQPGNFIVTTTDSSMCTQVSDTFRVVETEVVPTLVVNGNTTICVGDSVELVGDTFWASYNWNPTLDTTHSIWVSSSGTYFYTAEDSNGCTGTSPPVVISISDTVAPIDTIGSVAFCEGQSVVLTATDPNQSIYAWTPGNDSTQSIVVTQSGTYTLTTIDSFGCEATGTPVTVLVELNLLQIPLANDTFICLGSVATLFANTGLGSLAWYDENGVLVGNGPVFQPPLLSATTTFILQSELSLCTSDTNQVIVRVEDCNNVVIPNVITPNGDGVNDFFRIEIFENTCFSCKIYNRWGEKIYEFDQAGQGWDGRVKGREVSEGTYYYLLEYCTFDGSKSSKAGYLTVLR